MTSDTECGRSPDGSGSRPSDGAQEVSTVPASIPNASWLDDNLQRDEVNAFLAFFAGARSNVKIFVGPDGKTWPISFGKAECEWVPFHETWKHKFPDYGLTTYDESEPKPALGMAPGSTWTEAKIRVTEFGIAVRNAYWNRVNAASAIEARRAATAQTGSVHESATAESGDAQPQSVSGLSHTGVDRG